MSKGRTTRRALSVLIATAMTFVNVATAAAVPTADDSAAAKTAAKSTEQGKYRITQEEREAAAERIALQKVAAAALKGSSGVRASALPTPGPGGVPDYFGTTPNWAFSPLIRKFVDDLPGLGAENANELGQYIPIANPDTTTYPGADYYEIELREYSEKMHSDLPSTTLRGYVQVNNGTDAFGDNTVVPDPIHYLGPFIRARKDRPVRVKFTNKLATGTAGDLFIPVDTTVMGAGMGPLGMDAMPMNYTQNRATVHLHGGITPWISDGTPHQWITPADEDTPYPKGVSVRNVPDMPDPGDGSMTFFYTNQQSARMLWFHDHTFGITRLNVYAGEAGAYEITDPVEDGLIERSLIPTEQIPLIIQDKTFVDASTIGTTDPTWNWGTTPGTPHTGDLWVPHVYVPAQNPADLSGMNATGRWHYGPWFWPPTTNVQQPPIPNPYYDPINAPWEPELMPSTPNPSMGMETFNDTPLVNGTAYPRLSVQPKSYRFRILNAANDRFWNLQLYTADPATQSADLRGDTEVKMVPAVATEGFPELWPTDGREGGVPDPSTAGPEWIQIGTDAGFLPKPAVIGHQPITWNGDPTTFNMGNVEDHSLLVAPAERADVVVDFSAYAGQTLILYNDAPTAFPALDPRTDYYTGAPDMTDTGGTKTPQVGFGPNTRTIMQITVATATPDPAFDLDALNAAFASTPATPGVFASGANPIIVPDARYDEAYNDTFTADPYVRIYQNSMTFRTLTGTTLTVDMEPKAIQDEMGETFDPIYGRMAGKLGLEMPKTGAGNQNFIMLNYADPSTENVIDNMTPLSPVLGDGTQIWKITHNGVDTHPIHFHLFDIQLINRVGWDNGIRPPDDNELGWKDTVRVSPLEDTIVALRPIAPKTPFGVPDSIRPLDPTMPSGSTEPFSQQDPLTGQPLEPPLTNQEVNFGWEYMWHCHILSHEEMEMMRPISLEVSRALAAAPSLTATGTVGGAVALSWTDATDPDNPATWGDPSNEIGFKVQRAAYVNHVLTPYSVIATALANQTGFVDATTSAGSRYSYRIVAYNAAGDSPASNTVVLPPLAVVTRAAGADRYDTAVESAKVAFPGWTGVGHVVIASGQSEVDALSASGLAGAYDAPLLLSAQSVLPTTTRNALIAMPDGIQVHVVGGTGAVSNTVLTAIGAVAGVGSVERVPAGIDRYSTAANVAARMKTVLGSAFPTSAIVVNGANSASFFDALTASPVSAKVHYPILLVRDTSVPTFTLNAIASLPITRIYVIGGTGAVSAGVATQLGVAPGDRIAGATRYGTAVAVANRAASEGWLTLSKLGVASSVVDGLSGGAAMGRLGGPILLTASTSLPTDTRNFLNTNRLGVTDVYLFGGTGAISESVRSAIQTTLL